MVNKWSLYWADLNPATGSEQSGNRPVLVISNDIVNEILPVVTVIPVSSIKPNSRIYSTEIFLSKEAASLPKDSVAMVHQIRTISKERLGSKCGTILHKHIKQEVKEVLQDYFELC